MYGVVETDVERARASPRCDATETGVKIESDSEFVPERGGTTRLRGVTI